MNNFWKEIKHNIVWGFPINLNRKRIRRIMLNVRENGVRDKRKYDIDGNFSNNVVV